MPEPRDDLDQVAIVGMAGRFPGSADVEDFWNGLLEGREGIRVLEEEELVAAGVSAAELGDEHLVRAKGVLDGADTFDAAFFGYSPREAEVLDPQHRVLLECAWQALESAGLVPGRFDGRIGVFAGTGLNTYLLNNLMANPRVVESVGSYQTMLASDKDFLATRVAYKLGLSGPAMTVQTACSTSLTAVHLAVQSLLAGECDAALAGGVAVSSPLHGGYRYEPGGILSPDGHCRPFSAGAGGTVPGNGAGVVVLRRLADALRDGDPVRAVVLGTAVNNDGALKAGYTAPSVEGQVDVITEAMAVAGVSADTIGYVEAHGTGTALGDPIEVTALTRAYRADTDRVGYCALGSVKSNVGHLDAAAAVASLIKAVLVVERGVVPPTLHLAEPGPDLNLPTSPFVVSDRLREFPAGAGPRRAAVSAFGIGGTNVHLILQQPPAPAASGPAREVTVLPLAARTSAAVVDLAARLADHLEAHPDVALDDVAHTLAHRRAALDHRLAVVCRGRDDALVLLRQVKAADVAVASPRPAPVAFLFPGQGAQYVDMARGLYRQEPVFARELDRCVDLFAEHLGTDLRDVLFDPQDADGAAVWLQQTEITQPVLFAVEYALARLLQAWGVTPRAMAGHSIGEYVAACLAGVLTVEDAVRLVATRGRLVAAMPRGSMLSVFLPEAEVIPWLGDDLALAAVNSTGLVVVSGPTPAIEDLEGRLKAAGVGCRRLYTSHAFHSPSMDAAVAPLVAEVSALTLNPPSIPFCSDLTGTWITDEQAVDPAYWGAHLRGTVRFADCTDTLLADPTTVLIEIGPGHTLTNLVRQHTAFRAGRTVVGTLRHPGEDVDDRVHLLTSLGRLWAAGTAVDWSAVAGGGARRAVPLPGYPFQRQRFWVDPDPGAARADAAVPRTVEDWFSVPGWSRTQRPAAPLDGELAAARWLLLDALPDDGREGGLGSALADRLAAAGALVHREAAPADAEGYADLLTAVAVQGEGPLHLVHLPGLHPTGTAGATPYAGLLALAQGLDRARVPGPVTVDVLATGVFAVTGSEVLRPEQATLLGPCTVMGQELPDVTCRLLDVTGLDATGPDATEAVLAAVAAPVEDAELALRGRHWWRRTFDAFRPQERPDGATLLRDCGVYLITGGLGGVGLALAEHVAEHCDGPVLGLVSRSPFPAEEEWAAWLEAHDPADPTADLTAGRIRRLQRLRDLGALPVVLQGDVTDPAGAAAVAAALRERFGTVHGVVHAAGLAASGMIATATAEGAGRVLAAKVDGTLHLDRATADDDLDFFLLCSSATAVLGGPGQSDYTAANAFLDAFATRRRDEGRPVTSIGWGTWTGVGMAAGPGSVQQLTGPAGAPTGHPLLRRVQEGEGGATYASTFATADTWIVDDHRLMGHGLVPGTAYLELAVAAVADRAQGREVVLEEVLFLSPVIVPDGRSRTVYTTVAPSGDRLTFSVRSRAADGSTWRDHASGTIRFAERRADAVRDLGALLPDGDGVEVIDSEAEIRSRYHEEEFASGTGGLQFRFGPRWQVLHRVATDGRAMHAVLELDEAFRTDLADHRLHPALLDMAGGVFRLHAPHLYYLPLAYRRLRVLHDLTPTVHVAVRIADTGTSGETLTCDMELLDPDGRLLVQIDGFSVKRVGDVAALLAQIEQATSDARAEEGAAADAASGSAAATGGSAALATLAEGMSERDARRAFGALLAARSLPAHVLVTPRDLETLRRTARSITPASLAAELQELALPSTSHPRPELETPFVAPSTDDERAIAAVWQEVLGVEPVGVDDDFFALGGHSLAAVQIGTRLSARLGVELDMRDFFNAPTVAHTAALLASRRTAGGQDRIAVVDRERLYEIESLQDGLAPDLDELSDEEIDARLRELLAEEANDLGDGV